MIRALPAALAVIALIAFAVFVADRPGTIEIEWQSWRIDTSVAVLVLGVGLLAMLAAGLFHLLRKLVTAPAAMMRWRREQRRDAGYRALTRGMVAIAAGDPSEALKYARRADVLLAEPPLTLLLSAQAAQLNGDQDAAKKYFAAMLERPETEFLGLRGLLMQSLHAGDEAGGLKLVERAKELRPKTPWVLTQLYELRARAGDWLAAEATLNEAIKRRAVDDATGKHHRAVLLHQQSLGAEASGDLGKALALAGKAVDAERSFAPAAVHLAQLQAGQSRQRRAIKTLFTTWREAPHPELARAYHALFKDETPIQRVKRIEHLAAAKLDHLESRIALAEASLSARLWGEARRLLVEAGAAEAAVAPRVAALMARIEEEEHGDHAAARTWRMRGAESATADHAYVCDKCGAERQHWSALCPHCRAFASLHWRVPPRVQPASPMPAAPSPPLALVDQGAPRLIRSAPPRDATAADMARSLVGNADVAQR